MANDLEQVGFIAHPFTHSVPEVTADIHGYARIAAIAAGGEDNLRPRPVC